MSMLHVELTKFVLNISFQGKEFSLFYTQFDVEGKGSPFTFANTMYWGCTFVPAKIAVL